MAGPARGTMDFFAAQAAAKRRTGVLVVWFAVAIAATIAVIWLGVSLYLAAQEPGLAAAAFSTELALGVGGLVACTTGAGYAYHAVHLAEGGPAVARMLGGAPVDRRTQEPGERRLVNVVEEMAIAAGLPVPALYVLPEQQGINAFAAGYSPDRSVVAVTRGALDRLTRDELQGVVAHELSHVLNGDARLNLRLLALIGGITAVAAVGRVLADVSTRSSWSSSSRRRRGGGGGILLVGLVVWIAGAAGAFFGRVIRAAVSRQREFLADAAGVQFTRNPEGLAGALARVAANGSRVEGPFAPEASHLFFANGLRSDWLATHPPVEERIRRLVPQGFARILRTAAEAAATGAAPAQPAAASPAPPLTASALVASVGNAGAGHVTHAGRVLAALPSELVDAAREPPIAPVLVRALLADADPAVRAVQLEAIRDPQLRARVGGLAGALAPISRSDRMAVLDLALPTLDGMAGDDAFALLADLRALAAADGRTTAFEWALLRIVSRRLVRTRAAWRAAPVTARTVGDVEIDLLDLLSVLARAGARDDAGAQAALDAATAVLGPRGWRVLPRDRATGARLDAALERLDGASPALKARVVEACAASVLADGVVVPVEGEIVRAVAASLGVPVPPLLASAPAVRAASSTA